MPIFEAFLDTDYVPTTVNVNATTYQDFTEKPLNECKSILEFYRQHLGDRQLQNDHLAGKISMMEFRATEAALRKDEEIARKNKDRISSRGLADTAREFGPPELLPNIYNNTEFCGGTTVEVRKLKICVISRICKESTKWKENNELDGKLTANLWACVQDFAKGDKHDAGYARDASIALIKTNFLSETLLEDAIKMRGKIAESARTSLALTSHLAVNAEQLKVADVDATLPAGAPAWDTGINKRTSFDKYLDLATGAGYTAIGGLGLYVTDSRIELATRAVARKDLLAYLNAVPEHALEIPESVWTGLSRIREPLHLTLPLTTVMNGIGGVAAKVASKNLVKASFI
jgi:hypothetical protein